MTPLQGAVRTRALPQSQAGEDDRHTSAPRHAFYTATILDHSYLEAAVRSISPWDIFDQFWDIQIGAVSLTQKHSRITVCFFLECERPLRPPWGSERNRERHELFAAAPSLGFTAAAGTREVKPAARRRPT